VYLNHGSFGACPKAVLNELVRLQKLLEWQPIEFLASDLEHRLAESRRYLGNYVGCDGDDLVLFPNPTTAINAVVKSLKLSPGDEILSTNHEYGAMNRTWKYFCGKNQTKFTAVDIPVPVSTEEDFIERIWSKVTDRTKILFISHITSQTALIFPMKKLCRRAKEKKIITIIDGAHAPGQIPLNIMVIDPDIYSGACHKWMCAPKGVSFLYVRKQLQDLIDPLVVSWGWESDMPGKSRYLDYHQWQGTRDMSVFLTIPFTIEYLKSLNWGSLTSISREQLLQFQERLCSKLDIKPMTTTPSKWQGQMVSFILADNTDPEIVKNFLFSKYRIEVPVFDWNGNIIIRISMQPYNTIEELYLFEQALSEFLN
jgi:isopenicillin-N epimerase